MNKKGIPIFVLVLEILALTGYIWHQGVRPHLSGITIIPLLTLAIGILLYVGIRRYALFLAIKTDESHSSCIHAVIMTFSPLLLLYLVFLQHMVFLKDIRPYLLPMSIVGIIYLQVVFIRRLKVDVPLNMSFLENLSSKQVSTRVFLVVFLVYVVLASGLLFPPHPFTGDEPHYMILSSSILHDKDIDLFNNYQEKDYLKFYPGHLETHAFPGRKGPNHLYSKHLPGLSILLVPSFYVGEKAAQLFLSLGKDPGEARKVIILVVRLTICFFAALLSVVFFHMVADVVKHRQIALLSVSLFSFLSPMVFYSHLLYPEIPAALILLLIFRYPIYKKDHKPLILLMTGMGIAVLPWLGIKYTALTAVIFGIVMYSLLKSKSRSLPHLFMFISPILVSGCLYLTYLWALYGNFSPISVYLGSEVAQSMGASVVLNDSLAEAIQFNMGIFFDQRLGLFIYAPFYIVFLAGFIFFKQKEKNEALILLFIFGFYWLFCSLFPYWMGFCPPGRQMLPLLWILALFVAMGMEENRNRTTEIIKRTVIIMSLVIAFLALHNPMLLYHENLAAPPNLKGVNSHLLTSLSNAFVDLTQVVPSLINQRKMQWIPLGIWIIVVIMITLLLIRKRMALAPTRSPGRLGIPLAGVFVFSILFLFYVFFDIHLDQRVTFNQKGYELIFQNENHFGKELGGFWTKGNRRSGVLIKSARPLSEIKVELTSAVEGKTTVQIDKFKGTIARSKEFGLTSQVTVLSPVGFPWEGGYLYSLHIRDSKGFVPFEQDRNSQDNRFLGVFVEISTRTD